MPERAHGPERRTTPRVPLRPPRPETEGRTASQQPIAFLQRGAGNRAVAQLLSVEAPEMLAGESPPLLACQPITAQRETTAPPAPGGAPPVDEAARIAKLEADYADAVRRGDWQKAAVFLNAFSTDDIIAKLNQLTSAGLVAMQGAARSTNAGDGRLSRLVGFAGGTNVVHVDATEQVGANLFGIRGVYNYWITPDAIIIGVKMNFIPDPGVTVPVNTWFGHIRTTWNHYSAVNELNPSQKKRIEFAPIQAAPGHDIRVTAGTGRANAGQYFVGDTRAAETIPHEFGHLIGLEDEYERDTSDMMRIVGSLPADTGAAGTAADAEAIATELHDALFLSEGFFERHATAAKRRTAAVVEVLRRHTIVVDYQRGENARTHRIAYEYWRKYHADLSTHVMKQVDIEDSPGPTSPWSDWRERVVGSFQYTNSSLMGDMSDHSHPVQPRHVRGFATLVQDALGYGRWVPKEDH